MNNWKERRLTRNRSATSSTVNNFGVGFSSIPVMALRSGAPHIRMFSEYILNGLALSSELDIARQAKQFRRVFAARNPSFS